MNGVSHYTAQKLKKTKGQKFSKLMQLSGGTRIQAEHCTKIRIQTNAIQKRDETSDKDVIQVPSKREANTKQNNVGVRRVVFCIFQVLQVWQASEPTCVRAKHSND